ncbi:MAG: STAS domain-containing protein [Verrucomicrobia bacterium]|nr:STAS domain-containing protein [Verrucomicrobiota bacterium]
MKTRTEGDTLFITDFTELNTTNATWLQDLVRQSLERAHKVIELDLSRVRFLDSNGISALISIHKLMCKRGGKIRLSKPAQAVFQILELLSLNEVFEIINP